MPDGSWSTVVVFPGSARQPSCRLVVKANDMWDVIGRNRVGTRNGSCVERVMDTGVVADQSLPLVAYLAPVFLETGQS